MSETMTNKCQGGDHSKYFFLENVYLLGFVPLSALKPSSRGAMDWWKSSGLPRQDVFQECLTVVMFHEPTDLVQAILQPEVLGRV